jgi:hypothetical protein
MSKQGSNLKELTADIHKYMNKLFDGKWNCFVFKRYLGSSNVTGSDSYMDFSIDDFYFVIFKNES